MIFPGNKIAFHKFRLGVSGNGETVPAEGSLIVSGLPWCYHQAWSCGVIEQLA